MAKHTVVEIGTEYIKGLNGEFKKGIFHIDKAEILPAEKDFYFSTNAQIFNKQVKIVSECLRKLKMKTKRITIVVPDEITYNHFMVFPKLREKELFSAVKFQADQFIPLPLDKVSIDIDVLEETADKKNLLIMAVAIEKLHLSKITELCESLGIIPVRIENQISSLGKAFTYANFQNIPNCLFVNMSARNTVVYFYEEKRRLIFNTHTFKIGYELFAKELALTANIPLNEAKQLLSQVGINQQDPRLEQVLKPLLTDLISELRQSINLAQTKYAVITKHIFFINPLVQIKGLNAYIANQLQVANIQIDLKSAVRFKDKSINPIVANASITALGGLII